MKKRILSLVLAVVMLLGAMPLCASANNEETQINEIAFEFDLDGVIGKKFADYIKAFISFGEVF